MSELPKAAGPPRLVLPADLLSTPRSRSSRAPRNELSLEKKIEVILMFEDQKLSSRAIVKRLASQGYPCGKTQIQNIIKRKQEWIREFECNTPLERKRKRKTRKTCYDELNSLLYEWFKEHTASLLPVTGVLLQEKALEIATLLGLEEFKASNGWLESFRKRNNIMFGKSATEEAPQDGEIGEVDWNVQLPKIFASYSARDIFNLVETGLLFNMTTVSNCDHNYFESKQNRITLLLCCNALGEKETPMVIGNVMNPSSFGPLGGKDLPIEYHFDEEALMRSDFFMCYLMNLNQKMKQDGRKILIVLDNAPCHPHLMLSNIKLQFLPCNQNSVLQPLNLGIIHAVKSKFRKRQLMHVFQNLNKEQKPTGQELIEKTDMLQVVYWLHKSWRDISANAIKKCFSECGISVYIEKQCEEETEICGDKINAICQFVLNMSMNDFVSVDLHLDVATANAANESVTGKTDYMQNVVDEILKSSEDEKKLIVEQETILLKESRLKNWQDVRNSILDIRSFAVSNGCSALLEKCFEMEEMVNNEYVNQKSN